MAYGELYRGSSFHHLPDPALLLWGMAMTYKVKQSGRGLGKTSFERRYNCRIESITFTGQAGKELIMTIQACSLNDLDWIEQVLKD